MVKVIKSMRMCKNLVKEVQAQADKEKRSFSAMACILLERQLQKESSK